MQEHQQQVMGERRDLASKISKLRTFKSSFLFDNISHGERGRLTRQIPAMEVYLQILDERIEEFLV